MCTTMSNITSNLSIHLKDKTLEFPIICTENNQCYLKTLESYFKLSTALTRWIAENEHLNESTYKNYLDKQIFAEKPESDPFKYDNYKLPLAGGPPTKKSFAKKPSIKFDGAFLTELVKSAQNMNTTQVKDYKSQKRDSEVLFDLPTFGIEKDKDHE